MSTYINFTPAEREQARATDLAEFLRRQGYDLRREGRGSVWMNGGEKVSVQGNLWYNQYTREGGDAIDFARRFFDCPDYPSAVRLLLGADVGMVAVTAAQKRKEQKPFTLPPANSDMHRIYAYLMKQRGIDRDVIHAFTHAKLLYEEAIYHNCVFVGYDENGIARHAHKRGTTTGSQFKCNADGSNPQYSFRWSGTSERLFVFEAPIDMLSYITMYPQDWQQDSYVALCSVAPIAAKQMIEQNDHLRQMILCLDNDDAGNDGKRGDGRMSGVIIVVLVGAVAALILGGIPLLSHLYSLNIKSQTVGDGQHGTARWATKREIGEMYRRVPFEPEKWRKGEDCPTEQGIVVGCEGRGETVALADTGDVHALMVGAAGVGKTAYWLYPCIEYACATGMSFLTTDTKGDLLRNYGMVAKNSYGYHISVIDLRNPTRSNGNNLLHLVNKYMDLYKANPDQLTYKAKAEKYAKIIAKTVILSGMDGSSFGQNAYFYDAAEGLLTATILLVAEFCEPEKRHIVSVFKIIQELLAPAPLQKGQRVQKTQFQLLMEMLPDDHKAKWFAGAALNSSEQSMASVMSTALSRLNAFLDSELEQLLCFDTEIDAESFCKEKSAIFLILPEENPNCYFLASLFIQQLYREILAVADETGGKLKNRCVFFADEFGTMPKIESAEMMFSAARSRRLQIVPIIQSFAQLEKNYGKEGADIIVDNTQLIIFGGFAPNSSSADTLSHAMGNRTVQVGTVSRSKNDPSQSLQMASRPLMSADELKALPKGTFIVMKTGQHPMKTKLKLFFEWGIAFGKPYQAEEHGNRAVAYAAKDELLQAIQARYPKPKSQNPDSEIPEGAIPVGAEDLVLSPKPPKRGRSIRLHPRPQPHQRRPPEQGV